MCGYIASVPIKACNVIKLVMNCIGFNASKGNYNEKLCTMNLIMRVLFRSMNLVGI